MGQIPQGDPSSLRQLRRKELLKEKLVKKMFEEESKSKRMAAQQMRQNLVNAIINNDEQKRAQDSFSDGIFDNFNKIEKNMEDSFREMSKTMKNIEQEAADEAIKNPENSNYQSYSMSS